MSDSYTHVKILQQIFYQKDPIALRIDWWMIDPGQVLLSRWPTIHRHGSIAGSQLSRMARIY